MIRRQYRKIAVIAATLSIICAIAAAPAHAQTDQVKIVVNNVGYEKTGPKKAIMMFKSDPSSGPCVPWFAHILDPQGNVVDSVGQPGCGIAAVTSAQWNADGYGYFYPIDFTRFQQVGDGFRIRASGVASPPFSVGVKVLQAKSGAEQVGFFKGMRNTQDAGDAALPVFGSDRAHNIYGGWWDATGDPGKHLSHLAYSNYFTPQQIPIVVWALLHAHELQPDAYGDAALEEAAWGADYLIRSLAPEGYFYMSVFDNWGDEYRWVTAEEQGSGTRGGREICAWGSFDGLEESDIDATMNSRGFRSADYQSAMREGAGVSIAALARAYKAGISGDSSSAQYLAGAVRAYQHLRDNPILYQDDGRQNIIDYYCGLLAATELYNATGDGAYSADAREWSVKLLSLQTAEGWFYSGLNGAGELYRPFFHAAEEGFPVVALTRYYRVGGVSNGADVRDAIAKNLRWYHKITYEAANPFEYAKMYRLDSPPLGGGNGGGGPADLARGKTATASREEDRFTADMAFDGSSTTRWSSYTNISGEENNDQWIAVDLGQSYRINRVILNWEAAHGRNYRIEISTNRTAWVPVRTVTDGAAGRVTLDFDPVEARHVRMYGVERGLEHGGFSLWDFEVYGEAISDRPQSPHNAHFFIPKVNETGYWWQGENARLASMASAFILGAPFADPTGTMWADTLFNMATAQLDWILGRNPFNVTMMYGYGDVNYDHFPATRALDNIRGGICNGISSARANENNIEWIPYGGEAFWRNWRFIEQWLPHNSWYLIAISSLAYRMDNAIEDDVSARRAAAPARRARMRISALRGGNVRIELPFAAGQGTEAALYNMRGQRVHTHAIAPGLRTVSMRVPAKIARGTYIVSVKDVSGKNNVTGKVNLR